MTRDNDVVLADMTGRLLQSEAGMPRGLVGRCCVCRTKIQGLCEADRNSDEFEQAEEGCAIRRGARQMR